MGNGALLDATVVLSLSLLEVQEIITEEGGCARLWGERVGECEQRSGCYARHRPLDAAGRIVSCTVIGG